MAFNIIRQDIARAEADAIVISANTAPRDGGGGDSAVYAAAGREKLLAAREEIGILNPGDAKATPAFDLHAKYIIHVKAPKWLDGNHGEGEMLRACYRNALHLAEELKCESVVFPLLSSGRYRFPEALSMSIARDEIRSFVETSDMTVTLAVYDAAAFNLSKQLETNIVSYIDDHYVEAHGWRRESSSFMMPQAKGSAMPEDSVSFPKEVNAFCSLEDVLRRKEETFTEMLLRMIDERGLKDSEVYKKANIDRKLFSKIRSDINYHPKKKTVLALCFALSLSIRDALELLSRSGYALSPSSRADLIICYCLENEIYDIFEVNEILFRFDEPLLFDA